jgi:hypothetical protein
LSSNQAAVLLSVEPMGKATLQDIMKERVLFAAFHPGRNDQLVTTDDGVVRRWRVSADGTKETDS